MVASDAFEWRHIQFGTNFENILKQMPEALETMQTYIRGSYKPPPIEWEPFVKAYYPSDGPFFLWRNPETAAVAAVPENRIEDRARALLLSNLFPLAPELVKDEEAFSRWWQQRLYGVDLPQLCEDLRERAVCDLDPRARPLELLGKIRHSLLTQYGFPYRIRFGCDVVAQHLDQGKHSLAVALLKEARAHFNYLS